MTKNPILEIRGYSAADQLKVLAEADVMNFLIKVQDRMEHSGVSAAELGRRIGVSRSQVARWLRNENGVNARTLFLLARGLGYELDVSWRLVSEDRVDSFEEEALPQITTYSFEYDETVHAIPSERAGVPAA